MTATVQVVIVNWNGAEFLPDCLRAVAAQQVDGDVDVLVIDNGSTDGSLELLARDFPQVAAQRHDNNYAQANNDGVAGTQAPFVLLLNTDATLQPGCLAALVAALQADARAAAAAPRILGTDGRIWTTGIEPFGELYWRDRDHGVAADRGAQGGEVFGVSGCCALFRRTAWQQVGGQDPQMHMYYEDVDLACRLRAAGWHSLYVPAAGCVHVGHGSIRKAKTGKDALGERNRMLVIARHHPGRLLDELLRSPWFADAGNDELQDWLPRLAQAARLDVAAFALQVVAGQQARLRELGAAGELPKILHERERWIAMLLREVARLRIWRLPGRRLSHDERAFLDRMRGK